MRKTPLGFLVLLSVVSYAVETSSTARNDVNFPCNKPKGKCKIEVNARWQRNAEDSTGQYASFPAQFRTRGDKAVEELCSKLDARLGARAPENGTYSVEFQGKDAGASDPKWNLDCKFKVVAPADGVPPFQAPAADAPAAETEQQATGKTLGDKTAALPEEESTLPQESSLADNINLRLRELEHDLAATTSITTQLSSKVRHLTEKRIELEESRQELWKQQKEKQQALENRVVALSRAISDLTSNDEDLARLAVDLEKRLDELETKATLLEKKIASLDDSGNVAQACSRFGGRYSDNEESYFKIRGRFVRFVKINVPDTPVDIGLAPEIVDELLVEDQQRTEPVLSPRLMRSEPKKEVTIGTFWIQERLIDPVLYEEIMKKSYDEVSFDDATAFIEKLNYYCKGIGQFGLPSEGEFVYLGRKAYGEDKSRLRSCAELKSARAFGVEDIFGRLWQLTASPCENFGDDSRIKCTSGTMVKKGGSHQSKSDQECLPEFRAETTPHIGEPNTSLRLVLLE